MTAIAPHLQLDDDGVDGGAQLEQILPRLGALIAQVGPSEMLLATPCDGWSTRDSSTTSSAAQACSPTRSPAHL